MPRAVSVLVACVTLVSFDLYNETANAQEGACCISVEECRELADLACDVFPNSTWWGLGTDCLDRDLDGVADYCESDVGLMYWMDQGTTIRIRRSDLQGNNPQDLILDVGDGRDIAIDPVAEKVYWSTRNPTQVVKRANFDGTDIEVIVPDLDPGIIEGLALDLNAGKVYWIDAVAGTIHRANLDGSNAELLVTIGDFGAASIALDLSEGKMYWPTRLDLHTSDMRRADLDGTNIETLFTVVNSVPGKIALDLLHGKIYWNSGNGMNRANIDGSHIENLTATGLGYPNWIALDVVNGKMYWTDVGRAEIMRANLDGTVIQDVTAESTVNSRGIALAIDCNGNGVADTADIILATSVDCSGNGVPDECEPDCNGNGVADSCDILGGFSDDCNGNRVPDDCEPDTDCNSNGITDICDIASGFSPDCNFNSIPDECIWLEADCDGSGLPDSCEIQDGAVEDCNTNGIPDECDIANLTSDDCNGNGIPDECISNEIDCNENDVPDSCDIADGTSDDCNSNGKPDFCDLAFGTSFDCTFNDIPDECEPPQPECGAMTISLVPATASDGCVLVDNEVQCPVGENRVALEIRIGHWDVDDQGTELLLFILIVESDTYDNGQGDPLRMLLVPCDGNSSICADLGPYSSCNYPSSFERDFCKPAFYRTSDPDYVLQNPEGIWLIAIRYFPDDDVEFSMGGLSGLTPLSPFPQSGAYAGTLWVEIPSGARGSFEVGFRSPPRVEFAGPSPSVSFEPVRISVIDCNANGVPDPQDVADGTSPDCNENLNPDECDVDSGASIDSNENGIPDECECFVASVAVESVVGVKNRFVSFSAGDPGRLQAVRFTLSTLPMPYDAWDGAKLWVGPPQQVSEAGASVPPVPEFPNMTAATLQCDPFYADWSKLGLVNVFHEGIVPDGTYSVQVLDGTCLPSIEGRYSEPLDIVTAIYGDTVLDLSQTPPLPPNGPPVDIVDALAVLGRFSSAPGAIIKARADLEPACVDLKINVTDVLASLAGFQGLPYPFAPTAANPCDSTCPNPLP